VKFEVRAPSVAPLLLLIAKKCVCSWESARTLSWIVSGIGEGKKRASRLLSLRQICGYAYGQRAWKTCGCGPSKFLYVFQTLGQKQV